MTTGVHLSADIRDAVEDALRGLPEIGEAVHAHRLAPLAVDEVPGVVIVDQGEDAEDITIHAPTQIRAELSLAVRIFARDVDDVQAALARHRYQVQKALADSTLGGRVALVRYNGGSLIDSDELDPAVRGYEMRYGITYTVANNAPDTAL